MTAARSSPGWVFCPISGGLRSHFRGIMGCRGTYGCEHSQAACGGGGERGGDHRSEEHTSELQSQFHLVCRLLLETKKPLRASTSASEPPASILQLAFRPCSAPLPMSVTSTLAFFF